MITVHLRNSNGYVCQPFTGSVMPKNAVWIDLVNPTAEEDRQMEELLGIGIPTRDDM